MNESKTALELRIEHLERIVEQQQQHIVNIVRALRAHSQDFPVNLGTTTGNLKWK